jgi:hypothetical protein
MWQTLSMTSEIDFELLIQKMDELTDLEDGTLFPSRVAVLLMPKDSAFSVQVILEVQRGKPEMIQFTVTGVGEPLTATQIHEIPVSRVVTAVVKGLAAIASVDAPGQSLRAGASLSLDDFPTARNAGRAFARKGVSITDDDLKKVAEIYRSNATAKHEAVANYFPVSVRTASRYIKKARERGYIQEGE